MHSAFAGQRDLQSGQRFLDGSAPRLRRHAAFCESAAGESHSPSAGKDEKPSREHEGSALVAREARLPSLLDSYTNNRNTEADLCARPKGRGKHCGKFSIKGLDAKGNVIRYRRVNCGSWSCSYCGPRKARLAKRAIRHAAEELGLRSFLTLTLDPSKLADVEDDVRYLRYVFDKFRTYLRRKFRETPRYICVVEFTANGVPHLHILIDRYIEHAWISQTWDRLGGGKIVWIKRAKIQQISRYLSKYLTKDLLLSAPKGTRRITTARAIQLFPKFESEIPWALVRSSIWFLFEVHRDAATERQREMFQVVGIETDEEQFLKAFAIPLNGGLGKDGGQQTTTQGVVV